MQDAGRPVLVHDFSIGNKPVREGGEGLDELRKRVAGIVFDSGLAPIFPHGFVHGSAHCVPTRAQASVGGCRALLLMCRARARRSSRI